MSPETKLIDELLWTIKDQHIMTIRSLLTAVSVTFLFVILETTIIIKAIFEAVVMKADEWVFVYKNCNDSERCLLQRLEQKKTLHSRELTHIWYRTHKSVNSELKTKERIVTIISSISKSMVLYENNMDFISVTPRMMWAYRLFSPN